MVPTFTSGDGEETPNQQTNQTQTQMLFKRTLWNKGFKLLEQEEKIIMPLQ